MMGLAPPTIDDTLDAYKPSEEEKQLVNKLLKDAEFKHMLPGKVVRFLRARKGNEAKTREMLKKHVIWESRVKPLDLVLADINEKAVDSAFWRYMGLSNEGCPILEVRIGLWTPGEYSVEDYENYIAFFCTMLERQMKTETQYIIVVNLAKWTLRHANYLSYIKRMIDIAQNQMPDRLRRVMLFKTPYIFRASWGAIKPWLDPITADKVDFVKTVKRDEALASCQIDKSLLPERYGGTINEEDEAKLPVPGFTTPMSKASVEKEALNEEPVKEEVPREEEAPKKEEEEEEEEEKKKRNISRDSVKKVIGLNRASVKKDAPAKKERGSKEQPAKEEESAKEEATAAATEKDDLDEDERNTFAPPPAAPTKVDEAEKEAQKEDDKDTPASAFFRVMKRPRGTIAISGMKPRIVVIHKGHFRYYKSVPATEISASAPFLKSSPQGYMKGGLSGCTALRDTSYTDGLTVKISANGKDVDIVLKMESKEKVEELLNVFGEHAAHCASRREMK